MATTKRILGQAYDAKKLLDKRILLDCGDLVPQETSISIETTDGEMFAIAAKTPLFTRKCQLNVATLRTLCAMYASNNNIIGGNFATDDSSSDDDDMDWVMLCGLRFACTRLLLLLEKKFQHKIREHNSLQVQDPVIQRLLLLGQQVAQQNQPSPPSSPTSQQTLSHSHSNPHLHTQPQPQQQQQQQEQEQEVPVQVQAQALTPPTTPGREGGGGITRRGYSHSVDISHLIPHSKPPPPPSPPPQSSSTATISPKHRLPISPPPPPSTPPPPSPPSPSSSSSACKPRSVSAIPYSPHSPLVADDSSVIRTPSGYNVRVVPIRPHQQPVMATVEAIPILSKGDSIASAQFNSIPELSNPKTPTITPTVESPELIFSEEDSTGGGGGEREVRGGSIVGLVERLTAQDVADPDFLFVFLLTYRSFTTGQVLLSLLKHRFLTAVQLRPESEKISPIELRVINVIRQWLDNYFFDFQSDGELLADVITFIHETIMQQQPVQKFLELGTILKKIIDRKLHNKERRVAEATNGASKAPKPLVDKKLSKRISSWSVAQLGEPEVAILDFEPLEISRQLTLMSSNLFRSVQPKELLNCNWSKKGSANLAPNIHAITRRFNILSMWVQTEILHIDDLKRRALALSKMIQIAHHCFELQNYNDAKAIVAGTQSAAVYRLKKTWEKVKEKEMKWLGEIETALSSERSYRVCREMLQTLQPPCVPYLGMFLSDLVFIEDGNKDNLRGYDDSIINFEKRRKIATVIRKIQQLQQGQYQLERVRELATMLATLELPNLSEEELYFRSLEREPREQQD